MSGKDLILSDSSIPENVRERIGVANLETAKNGRVPVEDSQRRSIAIFDNGLIICAIGEYATPNVKIVIQRARKEGIQIQLDKVELRPEQILGLYESMENRSDKMTDADLVRRQSEIRDILTNAVQRRASDVHIILGKQGHTNIWFRSFGRRMTYQTLDNAEASMMIESIFNSARDVAGESRMNVRQGALDQKSGILPPSIQMVRLQYTPQNNGRGALIMRLIPFSKAGNNNLAELGYSAQQLEDFARMRRRTNGLYILAGKVSSGKTTTLQRILNTMYLEKNREILIFTIEDPVEIELEDAIQFPAKPQPDPHKKGEEVDGFEAGIMSILRSDANVGVLGEIRTAATAKRAIELVGTGHALWTTIHTGSALRILGRLLDLDVETYKLSDPDIVAGLIYQRLVGTMCKKCRIRMDFGYLTGRITKELAYSCCRITGLKSKQLWLRGTGYVPKYVKGEGGKPALAPESTWEKCSCLAGLVGRTVVAEVIVPDEKLLADFGRTKDLVAAREYWTKPYDAMNPKNGGMGGKPVIYHALTKIGAGQIDVNEVEEEVNFLSVFEKEYGHLTEELQKDIRELRIAVGEDKEEEK